MASIVKRKNTYSVVYNYINEHGESKQKWEKCANYKEAQKLKAEIEHQQLTALLLHRSSRRWRNS